MPGVDDMRYAVVDKQGLVVNVIEAPEGWEVDDHRLIETDVGGPDDHYDGRIREFTPVVTPDPGPSPQKRYKTATNVSARLAVIAKELGLTEG